VTASLLILAAWLSLGSVTFAQDSTADASRLASAKAAFDKGAWEEAARLAEGPAEQSVDLDFLRGLALARLQRWNEAQAAFEAGHGKAPGDSRFLVELAGIAYQQKKFDAAKHDLRRALRLSPGDSYAREFLGTIYFLEGNVDAALKYWNAVQKPRLHSVVFQPTPKLKPELLQQALAFNAPQVLTDDALTTTEARLENLGVFPHQRVELAVSESGNYDATLHLAEQSGWGDSKLDGIISLLSGLPYETVYPEYWNFSGGALNFTSLARWDSQKRRYSGEVSAPLLGNPALRIRGYFDARNENWNLSQTFFGAGVPLSDLNMRRFAGGVAVREVENGNWSWSAGAEFVHRDFRNLEGQTSPGEQPFFTNSESLAASFAVQRTLLRIPEERFTLESSAEGRAGRSFSSALGAFATTRGGLKAHWLPQATGDDYEMQAQFRAGATAGRVPFDELFELGLERDNDLWLRGEPGTTDGRKGAAPLGRRYVLTNWEMDKNVYRGGFFTIKVGPFLDNGAIADASGLFGSRGWLWNAGAQCKIRVLGNVTAVLIYGRDLRGGRNVFYGTVLP
jgi:hypothetical protein